MRHEHLNSSELVRFRHQYVMAKRMTNLKIVRPLSWEPLGHSYALVMADEGTLSLEAYAQQRSLPWPEVLQIALQLTDILYGLSQHRVIHKDIKPAHLLIHPASKAIQLIDFSLASQLPRETQELQNPHALKGTLAYMAPEQTGRMNRSIDYRADYYALGCTLYQLLTGHLPFEADDPWELVHCHLAKVATPIHKINLTVPQQLSAIVAKLMAKTAEARYQSALGLKYDLEQCRTQWEGTGTVSTFDLGQQDDCDCFIIPEKLYGRETAVEALLKAGDRILSQPAEAAAPQCELMLIAGASGSGKTTVVNELHEPITRHQGYFITGKFDQFDGNSPFSAFTQALQNGMEQLLSESAVERAKWRTDMLAAVGDEGQVLIELVPALEPLIGPQPPTVELSGAAAQQHLEQLFQALFAVLATAAHPLVIFLDDLQWADAASLQLIKLLINRNRHLLLIGAYRDHEVSSTHPLAIMVEELQKTSSTVNTLTLAPLSLNDTHQLIADTLRCSKARSCQLAQFIHSKTQGHPLFLTRLLKSLHADGFIQFDRQQKGWDYEVTQVSNQYLHDDVVEFIAQELQKLPSPTQQLLPLAACLGHQFDLSTLAIISQKTEMETAAALWPALQSGWVLPIDEAYKFFQADAAIMPCQSITVSYKFLHDRVQQAADASLPSTQKACTHLRIGRLMLEQLSKSELERQLFDIANRISPRKSLITHTSEQYQFSQLLLRAARKAIKLTDYSLASQYCQVGIELLGPKAWQQQRSLTQELYEVSAKVAYSKGDFEQLEALVTVTLNQSNTALEKIPSYKFKMLADISQGRTAEALAAGLKILSELKVELPSKPGSISTLLGLLKTKALLGERSVKSLANSPSMEDDLAQAKSVILNAMLPAAYTSAPNLYLRLISQQIELLLKYGNDDSAPSTYSSYGVILSSLLGDIEMGYQFGELALKLLEHSAVIPKVEAEVIYITYGLNKPWKHHLNESSSFLLRNYHRALATGEHECAAWSILTYLRNTRSVGMELAENAQQHMTYIKALETTQKRAVLNYGYPSYRFTLRLLDDGATLAQLDHQGQRHDSLVATLTEADDRSGLCAFYLYELMFAYWVEDWEGAQAAMSQCQTYLDGLVGFYEVQLYWWFATLTALAVYPQSMTPEPLRRQMQRGRKKLEKWAHHAPMNTRHKFDLVEAERYRVEQQPAIAADFYERAINGAKNNGYLQEAALANELAAKFYLDWGKATAAAAYMQAAYSGYAHWGAQAKAQHLAQRYPRLLQPVLQPPMVNPWAALERIAVSQLAPPAAMDRDSIADQPLSSLKDTSDLGTLIQRSQELSQTLQLDDLLRQLPQIMLQASGGDRGVLLLPDDQDVWQVRALATRERIELCQVPLEGNADVPVRLIQHVQNTQERVVVDDNQTDLPVIDPWLNQHQPKSLAVIPILHHGRLMGILQLSHQSARDIFNRDCLLIVNFLCTQAAIALENARLYQALGNYSQTLEAKIAEQTMALQDSKARLRFALRATNQGFYNINLPTGEVEVSPEYALMLGYDPETFREQLDTWRARLHPDDVERMRQAYGAYKVGKTTQYKVEFRLQTQPGDWKWILSMGQFTEWDEAGQPTRMLGIHIDISDRKYAELQLEAQNALLAKIAQGHPLTDVLNTLIETVEHDLDGVLCSVLLLDQDRCFRLGAAPSLPDAYNQAIEGVQIGEGVGSCGTAAFRNELVIVTDIETDPHWCPYRQLALSHGLRACWSSPITAQGGEVLGTFAMYYRQARSPQPHEMRTITQMAHIAGIAIRRHQAETRLRQSEATLLRAQQVAHVGNWELDLASQTLTWSPEMFRIYGLTPGPAAPAYEEYLRLLPESVRDCLQHCIKADCDHDVHTLEYSRAQADGSLAYYEWRAEAERNAEGRVIHLFGTTLDITERKQTELALQNLIAGTAATTGQDLFPALVQHIAQALDVDYAVITQKIDDQLQTLAFWANGTLLPQYTYPLIQTPCEQVFISGEFLCERNVQQAFPHDLDLVELEAESYLGVVLLGSRRQALGHLFILHKLPITNLQFAKQILHVFAARAAAELERQQAQALITHNALHDPLTGLPNRALLLERLERAIQRTHRFDHYRYAVVFLDLDRFKVINDSLGHVVGDQLLVAIARRLKNHVRQSDLVARLGGDEFLILLDNITSTEEVTQIARRILTECQTPITIDSHQIFTGLSIGIVMGDQTYQHASDLIRDADIAMYQAKSHKQNSYRFFDTAMHTAVLRRLQLETDLRKALEQQELTIYYQPIVSVPHQRLVSFEALVRWQHPTQGLIGPDEFIPVAEETGLITLIDSWMLKQACRQLADWRHQFADGADLKISINLSAQDLYKTHLIMEIDQVLADTGLPGHAIALEITESLLIQEVGQTVDLLMQLAARGVQISIDDFGTGYSSLSYLHRLPVNSLKIDRSFVSQMETEPRNYQVVSTILTLSQQLGLTAIAEGIETPQQLKQLQALGCQLGQGYLFAKPLTAWDIELLFLR
ncbi:MAG: EAL domain-containing protein [Cyanobacteria bacterium P01_H01_bin.152]